MYSKVMSNLARAVESLISQVHDSDATSSATSHEIVTYFMPSLIHADGKNK